MSSVSDGGMIYWQGKTEELEEKPVAVPLCSPQIPHGLTRARNRASTGRRLTTWAMARPEGAACNDLPPAPSVATGWCPLHSRACTAVLHCNSFWNSCYNIFEWQVFGTKGRPMWRRNSNLGRKITWLEAAGFIFTWPLKLLWATTVCGVKTCKRKAEDKCELGCNAHKISKREQLINYSDLQRLLTFKIPNHVSVFRCLGRSKESVQSLDALNNILLNIVLLRFVVRISAQSPIRRTTPCGLSASSCSIC
jgi:hypothetical protein